MQERDFKEILQKHAGQFSVQPSSDKFSGIMEVREKVKKTRKRRVGLFLLVAGITVLTGFALVFAWNNQDKSLLTEQAKETQRTAERSESDVIRPYAENGPETEYGEKNAKKADRQGALVSENKRNPTQRTVVAAHKNSKRKTLGHTEKADRVNTKKNTRSGVSKQEITNGFNPVSVSNETENQKAGLDNVVPVIIAQTDEKSRIDTVVTTVQSEEQKAAAKNDTLVTNGMDTALTTAVIPTPVTKSKADKQRWIASMVFTPQLVNSVYSANSDADLSWMNNYLDNKRENDQAKFCYNAGVRIERMLGEHFSIGTGAFLSVIKFEELKVVHELPPSSPDSAGPGVELSFDEGKVRNVDQNRYDISFTSLEIPLMVGYTIPMKNFYIQLNSGVAYSYLLTTRSLVFDKTDSLNVRETNDAKNNRLQHHNILLIAGMNAGYKIGTSWSVYMGPVYRYALQSLYSKDYVIKQKPYFIGLEMGVRFHF